ncbi:MAG: alpha/beta fold hydrolase [Xanthomonadales bacterium]|nr:alpha/beta fold hydrolase [Gammaproteobacteria bacterium]MBT8054831.1 alpha/beta fold hydrolase [Gammaproteobacteria bacterium]NND58512.1 alpha/beta fold hydrolase [Xanthomonadales bacterium]NNK51096.1 alpha/beta fold hydrolase [Xanthomonadales bacterium]
MSKTFSEFKPPLGLRSGHVQSLISSSAIRRRVVLRRSRAIRQNAEVWTLDGGEGIRLQGLYSKQPAKSRGLVVLLHGWEGSVNSNYVLGNSARLYQAGFDIFRLNFRDHGDTHHLNHEIFHSCRLDEVVCALRDLQNRLEASRWFLAGYSLGGNFAMRVALRSQLDGVDISHIVAVCPVINPANAMLSMEQGIRFYEVYFERKWSRSLRIKKAAFPDLYGQESWHDIKGLRERTHYLATRHAGFDSADEYFEGYSIADGRLAPLEVPSTILTSADDPVVPVSDFADLPTNPNLELIVTKHGGHCGFLKNWKLESMAEDLLEKRFLDAASI